MFANSDISLMPRPRMRTINSSEPPTKRRPSRSAVTPSERDRSARRRGTAGRGLARGFAASWPACRRRWSDPRRPPVPVPRRRSPVATARATGKAGHDADRAASGSAARRGSERADQSRVSGSAPGGPGCLKARMARVSAKSCVSSKTIHGIQVKSEQGHAGRAPGDHPAPATGGRPPKSDQEERAIGKTSAKPVRCD